MESTETTGLETRIERMISWCSLPSRSLIAISGPERIAFLDGLCTQKISPSEAGFSALLTPKGRFFADFFTFPTENSLILDCAQAHHAPLMDVLQFYAPLHDVSLHDYSTRYGVCAALGPDGINLHAEFPFYQNCTPTALFYTDPRHPDLGLRALIPYDLWNALPHPCLNPCPESVYHHHRIHLGIPEGAYDLVHDQSIILEYGYQHMNAISWTKGCYMGQELMARTFHRGVIRKHLYRATLQCGVFPESGTPLVSANDLARIGWMGSHCGDAGLMVLHEDIDRHKNQCGVVALDTPDHQPFSAQITVCS
jgi:folate-binding protein YgfZ